MTNEALRYNEGKPDYTLVDFKALEPMVRVLEYGAKKYARNNWRKGLDKHNILGSLQRHVGNLIDKVNSEVEEVDDETKLHEIGHIMCNCMFYAAQYVNKNNKNEETMPRGLDSFNWEEAERREKAQKTQGYGFTPTIKPQETTVKLDPEDLFYKKYGHFPDADELQDFCDEHDLEYEEEEIGFEYEEDDDHYEGCDCSECNPDVDPIMLIIEKGDKMERTRWNTSPSIKIKPVIELKKTEKSDNFVDSSVNKLVKNDRSVRGLGFRTQKLI